MKALLLITHVSRLVVGLFLFSALNGLVSCNQPEVIKPKPGPNVHIVRKVPVINHKLPRVPDESIDGNQPLEDPTDTVDPQPRFKPANL
ncbi:hypothetical protein HNV11_20120 [Spirosoma taeanense]|uniref:Uncharacterized protein n=1 Tax=Spirosoma taeanense TaxID=2735870 RepID=A0A6M5YE02_9BACT|nr:hypothetical protein [Spirosoma taeanense]QJW91521.1 hypothetical protein HNV11_20120 [Spirosoma taeanense]